MACPLCVATFDHIYVWTIHNNIFYRQRRVAAVDDKPRAGKVD